MICKQIIDNIFKQAWAYFLHTVKWFNVLLSNKQLFFMLIICLYMVKFL